jgi:hypothetical protein
MDVELYELLSSGLLETVLTAMILPLCVPLTVGDARFLPSFYI